MATAGAGASPSSMGVTPGRDVCLVISAFKSDEAVAALLEQVATTVDPPWSRVIVVDSLGSGAIDALIERSGWDWAEYHSFPTNLGSAGNLATRLTLAAERGFGWAYAINHDGVVDAGLVRTLRTFAATRADTRPGAVYPLRRYTRRGNRYDVTGRWRWPLPFLGSSAPPVANAFRVHWASSNGALYALEPIRRGIRPWADLWLGYEDLTYGWLLEEAGYSQWVVSAAVLDDDYEYRLRRWGPAQVGLAEKPAWYSYYHARNLLLAAGRSRAGPATRSIVAARIAIEFGLTLVARPNKARRLQLLARGVWDGLRGVAGKGPVP